MPIVTLAEARSGLHAAEVEALGRKTQHGLWS